MMQRAQLSLFFAALAGAALCGCDDGPPSVPAASTSPEPPAAAMAAPQPARPAAAAAGAAAGAASASEEGLAVEREIAETDFVESATSRDPFRSYLQEFAKTSKRVTKDQRRVLLKRYALDELTLIAVVAGGTRPLAMFRDPSGLGVTVKRGDLVSKSAGRVKQILRDKIVIEIEEQSEDQSTVVDRVIEMNPRGEAQAIEVD